jgi:hypothetical protein
MSADIDTSANVLYVFYVRQRFSNILLTTMTITTTAMVVNAPFPPFPFPSQFHSDSAPPLNLNIILNPGGGTAGNDSGLRETVAARR